MGCGCKKNNPTPTPVQQSVNEVNPTNVNKNEKLVNEIIKRVKELSK